MEVFVVMRVAEAVLADPLRLAAVERSRRALPVMPIPLDAAAVTLVGQHEEFFAGTSSVLKPLKAVRRTA